MRCRVIVSVMKHLAAAVLLLITPLALPQDQVTGESCRASEKLFYNSPSISTLTASERSGIIRTVLPDLKKSQANMGMDTAGLTPQHLGSMLRYTELAVAAGGERVAAITFRDPDQCGNHGQCTSYLLGIGPTGVRSLVPETKQSGLSVGGSWGAAVLPRGGSTYPDLLVLATISGSEVAVACYRWQGKLYDGSCNVPCSQILAHPDQQ